MTHGNNVTTSMPLTQMSQEYLRSQPDGVVVVTPSASIILTTRRSDECIHDDAGGHCRVCGVVYDK